MEKDVLQKLGMHTREEAIGFLKSLWDETPKPCPKCGGKLGFLHKKAKKDNCDWKCTSCGEVYRTLNILDELNEK